MPTAPDAIPDDADLTIGAVRVESRAPASARFAPGSIIAGRYRLIALLGKGGMGEVYRAEDLTLDQQVALKFLPERGNRDDPAALAQFHHELRIARQVSHKNVCRLYDLGEADGRRFLTMEYVDGEDLASLVRRIGRIPPDKATDIARQICAGLAAAHDRGVVHRDLKPANVMLDGDGNVRITDFGLVVGQTSGHAASDRTSGLAGTLQYMAPEQLAGDAASVKSDVYALGLVLFEIFTGKRALDAKTIHELRDWHSSGRIASASSIVRDLDPAVERVIQRCLDRDPSRRPTSALAVAAALPGGDPLADALAAGETPSPELLVAAAERDALPVWQGLVSTIAIVAGLIAFAALAPALTFARRAPLQKAPVILADRAEQLLTSLGYDEPRGDTAEGFQLVGDYVQWIAATDPSAHRWDRLASGTPAAMSYWYRTSPRDLVQRVLALRPTQLDPPPTLPGMHAVVMDTQGRLLRFDSVPPQHDTAPTSERGLSAAEVWPRLFEAAGLSFAAFSPVAPQWTPRDFADARNAWEGPLPGSTVRVRVEAASYRKRVTAFRVIGPWTQPTATTAPVRSGIDRLMAVLAPIVAILLTFVAALLARHNLRERRADVAAATKLALAAFGVEIVVWLVGSHHVSDVGAEISSLTAIASDAGFVALGLWINYVAFEPYCRRFWPDMLLGWTRLLAGHVRDPRVGRDLLAGLAGGVAWLLIGAARQLLPRALGRPPVLLRLGGELTFTGPVDAVRVWAILFLRALIPAFGIVLMLVLLRLATKRPQVAVALTGAIIFVWWSSFGGVPVFWIELTAEVATVSLLLFVMIRFGLLAALATLTLSSICQTMPLTLDVHHWSAAGSNQTLALFVALTLFAFFASRAGKPLFGTWLTSA